MKPDIVIVGGGTSGSALAARLSENSDCNVLLLEAGASDESYTQAVRETKRAASNVFRAGKHVVRWPQKFTSSPLSMLMMRGNVLGGTSAINYMVAVRGMPDDFDARAEMGCDGWAWADVLPYFRKVENDTDFGASDLHGDQGPMRVRRWPIAEFVGIQRAFYDGIREMGVSEVADINNRNELPGMGSFPGTVSDDGDTRLSVSQAYLTAEVRQRNNLTIRTYARVARVIVSQGKTQGVELLGGEQILANQVVLCCEAFESPKILMLSGIGPEAELRRHNIPIQVILPGVGQNLQDHVALSALYRAPYRGPLTGGPAKSLWIGASNGDDLDFHVMPNTLVNMPLLGEICYVLAFNLRPTTTGSVKLRSAKPEDNPDLDLNFLTSTADLRSVLEPLKQVEKRESTEAFKSWGGRRLFPRNLAKTPGQASKTRRLMAMSYFHYVGSCAMGPDSNPNAVLDSRCRGGLASSRRQLNANHYSWQHLLMLRNAGGAYCWRFFLDAHRFSVPSWCVVK